MRRPTFEDRLEYVAVIAFVKAASMLPAGASVWFAAVLGKIAFGIIRFRRGVTLSNIGKHLTGSASDRVNARIGSSSYASFGMGTAEFARLPGVTMDYMKRHIRLQGLEHLDTALDQKKGAILVTGHFGSWELMGCILVLLGYPVDFVVGVQRNPLVQMLMNDLRRAAGIGIIEPDSLLRMVRTLRANRFIAMLSDQDAGRHGVFVEFLGAPASTPQGAARLALMTGAPVIPGFIIRLGGIKHRIVIEKPIYAARGVDKETAIADVTQSYTRVIETYVKRYPDHYLWAHRRWKTKKR